MGKNYTIKGFSLGFIIFSIITEKKREYDTIIIIYTREIKTALEHFKLK